MTTILSVLVVAACWVVALCHNLPKASLFWARGGAGADKVVLRVRAPDGAVSRLTLENVLTIGDIVQEISKLIRAEMLNDVEVSIKHDPAQSIETLRSNISTLSSLDLNTGDWITISIPKEKKASLSQKSPKSDSSQGRPKQTSETKQRESTKKSVSSSSSPTSLPSKKGKKVFTVKDLEAERQKLLQMHKESVQGEVKVYMLQEDANSQGNGDSGKRRGGGRISRMQGVESTLQRIAQHEGTGLLFGRWKEIGGRNKVKGSKSTKGLKGKKSVDDSEDTGHKQSSKYTYEVLAVCELPPHNSPMSLFSSPLCEELRDLGQMNGMQVLGVVVGVGKQPGMWTWDNLWAGLEASSLMSPQNRNHTLSLSIRYQTKDDLKIDDAVRSNKDKNTKSIRSAKFSSSAGNGLVMEAFQLHPLAFDLYDTKAISKERESALGKGNVAGSKKKPGNSIPKDETEEQDVVSLANPIIYGGREVTSLPLVTLSRPLGVTNVYVSSLSSLFVDHTYPSPHEMDHSSQIQTSSQVYLRKLLKNISGGKISLEGAEGGRIKSMWLLRTLKSYLQPATFASLCDLVKSSLYDVGATSGKSGGISEELKLELQMLSEGLDASGDAEEL